MSVIASQQMDLTGIPIKQDACVVLVSTEWNLNIINELERGAKSVLEQAGVKVKIIKVPGVIEIGFAIKNYWDTFGQIEKEHPDAFIALGCVIKGDTPHFDYVCQSVTQAVTHLNLHLPTPVIFGILTVNNHLQAFERIGGRAGHKGIEAAVTALKMMAIHHSF